MLGFGEHVEDGSMLPRTEPHSSPNVRRPTSMRFWKLGTSVWKRPSIPQKGSLAVDVWIQFELLGVGRDLPMVRR